MTNDEKRQMRLLKEAVRLLAQPLSSGKNPILHQDGFGGQCSCGDCKVIYDAQKLIKS